MTMTQITSNDLNPSYTATTVQHTHSFFVIRKLRDVFEQAAFTFSLILHRDIGQHTLQWQWQIWHLTTLVIDPKNDVLIRKGRHNMLPQETLLVGNNLTQKFGVYLSFGHSYKYPGLKSRQWIQFAKYSTPANSVQKFNQSIIIK